MKCHISRLTEAHAMSFNSVFLYLSQLRNIHTSVTQLTTWLLKARRSLVHVITDALSDFVYSSREVEHCQQLTALLGNIVIWTVIFH